MINFIKILSKLILEDAPKTSKNNALVSAIKNRNPVSFYYNGPRDEVLPGRRIKAELVAMGLTKKGNLVVRGWVQPPSVSKKGFEKHGWRLFKIKNMSGIQIYDDETFDEKRPQYKEGDDGSLTVTYVTTDWGRKEQPRIERPTPPPAQEPTPQEPAQQPTPQEPPAPEEKPEVGPEGLPQPKPKDKPSPVPQPEVKRDIEVFNDLKNKINTINNEKTISPNDMKDAISVLYKKKTEDWTNQQKVLNKNTIPGEGTRRKLEKDAEFELYNLLKGDNIKISNQNVPLQEAIKRMKTLILY